MNLRRTIHGGVFATVVLSAQCLAGTSFYTDRLQDPEAVYFTQEAFPVHADGVADDAPALQQAIDKVGTDRNAGVLFIPEGRYRLSRTVYVWPGVRLIGYGEKRPVLILGANTPGFQGDESKYLIYFSGGRGRDGTPRDGNPGTFYSAMSNIDIEIGPGNPAAVGVRFHVAQHCYLSHMDFHLGEAKAGLQDIGNEIEDLRFFGGQYGIMTRRSAPGWPILAIDCTFEGQKVAALLCDESGLTLVRPRFRNIPTAVSVVPEKPDELWISDARMEGISGPALVISDERNARTQINLRNVACQNVPILARFRESGREERGRGTRYIVTRFTHGLDLGHLGSARDIGDRLLVKAVETLGPPVASDIPDLPASDTWVNVHEFGVAGDGKTDDTAALQKAINEYRVLYLPQGWYNVSDTLVLRPDTILIGLNPSTTVIHLPNDTSTFQGGGSPKPLLEAPRGGTNVLTGIGIYTDSTNPRAVGVKWMAGPRSMVNDVRFHGGHGTRVPGSPNRFGRLGNRAQWDTQHASLWITDGGGGTFKDIWTPNPYASAGMEISHTSTSGRVYAVSIEHHTANEMIIDHASNWRFFALQFEEEREEGPRTLPLKITNSSDLQFANVFFYRVVSSFVPFPHAVEIADSLDVRFRNLHCYSNSRVSFDSSVYDVTSGTEIRDSEYAALDVAPKRSESGSVATSSAAESGTTVEKLADGFLNIAAATADAHGDVYFTDSHEGQIYRWSVARHNVELVRHIPQGPVQLAFDRAGHLLVLAYSGNGTVLSFDPTTPDSEIKTIEARPYPPPDGAVAVLPVNRWMGHEAFLQDSTMKKPFYFTSPDGTIFVPAGQDFVSGAVMWGIKLSDVLRAFDLAPAVAGRPFYVTNEAELRTWAFDVQLDGSLANPRLFVEEGGEALTTDDRGNVYLAAGQVRVFNPSGEPIEVIRVPQRPTSLVFGGPDRETLFITARSALYATHPESITSTK
ncbi:MAG: glycosyl hydrolase family 28-related protein [Acidobacteriota bacterium]